MSHRQTRRLMSHFYLCAAALSLPQFQRNKRAPAKWQANRARIALFAPRHVRINVNCERRRGARTGETQERVSADLCGVTAF